MGVVGILLVLVLAEPDFGSTALMASVSFAMMFVAGVRLRFLSADATERRGGVRHAGDAQSDAGARLMAFMDLDKYKKGAGYQVWQAILAFGSGGFNGVWAGQQSAEDVLSARGAHGLHLSDHR